MSDGCFHHWAYQQYLNNSPLPGCEPSTHRSPRSLESLYENVLTFVVVPTNLAIDWYSRLLYFTDYNSGSIQVLSLKGWTTKTLIKQWDISVTDIALHPTSG